MYVCVCVCTVYVQLDLRLTYVNCNFRNNTDVQVATVNECATFPHTTLQLHRRTVHSVVATHVTSFPGTPSSTSYLDGCQHSCRFRRVASVMLLRTYMSVSTALR
jgi:hypothetical protein